VAFSIIDIIEAFAVLAVSVTVLSRSSALVVDNALRLSQFFRISQIALGFLFIAVSTSLPALSVSVVSSTLKEGAIAAGDVFGSNIANTLLILGLAGFLYGLKISPHNLRDIGLVLLLTTVISAYIVFGSSLHESVLGFLEGAVLLCIFAGYAWYVLSGRRPDEKEAFAKVSKRKALEAFLLFGMGIIIVLVSSGFVVGSAVDLAQMLGVAQSFIGATIIAAGTSLPGLSVDLQAVRRRQYSLVLGDAIGSNMVNMTLVLGSAAIINPITINLPVFIAALLFAVIANMALLYAGAVNKGLGRIGGGIFLAFYIIYVVMIFALQYIAPGPG
jgi:cation:H+ antiporter